MPEQSTSPLVDPRAEPLQFTAEEGRNLVYLAEQILACDYQDVRDAVEELAQAILDKRAANVECLRAELAREKAEAAKPRTCNRHKDCDAADRRAKERGQRRADHCHDEFCEDCFGT